MSERITGDAGEKVGGWGNIIDLQMYATQRARGTLPAQAIQLAAHVALPCTSEQNYPELRKHFAEALSFVRKEPGQQVLTARFATIVNEAFGGTLSEKTLLKELLLTEDHSLHWHPAIKDSYIYTAYDGTEYSIQKTVVSAIDQILGRADRSGYTTVGLLRSTSEQTLHWHVPKLGIKGIRFIQKAFATR